jgi:hypothetical protein
VRYTGNLQVATATRGYLVEMDDDLSGVDAELVQTIEGSVALKVAEGGTLLVPEARLFTVGGEIRGRLFAAADRFPAGDVESMANRAGIPADEAEARQAFIEAMLRDRIMGTRASLGTTQGLTFSRHLEEAGSLKERITLSTLISSRVLSLPKRDAIATIFHESMHVLVAFEMNRVLGIVGADEQIEGIAIDPEIPQAARLLVDIYNQLRASGVSQANTLEAMRPIEESLCYTLELKHIDSNGVTTWRKARESAELLKQMYGATIRLLRENKIAVDGVDRDVTLSRDNKNAVLEFLTRMHGVLKGLTHLKATASSEEFDATDPSVTVPGAGTTIPKPTDARFR